MGRLNNRVIVGEKSFTSIHYKRKHYKDKLIRGILEDLGMKKEDLGNYELMGFPKSNPKGYYLINKRFKSKSMSPQEILKIMFDKLSTEEFNDWCLSNIGVLDVLGKMFNTDENNAQIEIYKKMIDGFINNKNVRAIKNIIDDTELKEDRLLYRESIDMLEIHVDKVNKEKDIVEGKLKLLQLELAKYKSLEQNIDNIDLETKNTTLYKSTI